jgi:hypothetical protein
MTTAFLGLATFLFRRWGNAAPAECNPYEDSSCDLTLEDYDDITGAYNSNQTENRTMEDIYSIALPAAAALWFIKPKQPKRDK